MVQSRATLRLRRSDPRGAAVTVRHRWPRGDVRGAAARNGRPQRFRCAAIAASAGVLAASVLRPFCVRAASPLLLLLMAAVASLPPRRFHRRCRRPSGGSLMAQNQRQGFPQRRGQAREAEKLSVLPRRLRDGGFRRVDIMCLSPVGRRCSQAC